MRERPEHFRINPYCDTADGLVFAGLGGGGCVGSTHYHDSSRYGNHGTLTNMEPAADWVFDPTLGRFGLDCYSSAFQSVYLANPFLIGTQDFCVACWAKLTVFNISASTMMGCGDSSAGEWMFRVADSNADTSYLSFYGASGTILADQVSGGFHPYKNTLVHLVARRRAGVVNVLLNGNIVATDESATGNLSTTKPLQIGGADNASGRWWNGPFYDPMVWVGVGLDDGQIQQLADPSNTLLSGLILPPSRVVWPVAVAAPSIPEGSAVLSAVADLAATGYAAHSGSATLTAQAAIAAVGYRESAGTATLSAIAGLEAVGYAEHSGAAVLSAVADIEAVGYTEHAGHAVLSAIADITATGEAPALIPEGSAVLSAVASIDATGYAEANGHAVLSAIADMAAVGEAPVVDVPQGYAVLDAVADMAAEGYAEHAGYAVLSAVAGITAVGEAKGGEVPATVGKTADGLTWADVDGLEWVEVDGLVWAIYIIASIAASQYHVPLPAGAQFHLPAPSASQAYTPAPGASQYA
jgi:hypothetical protein